MKRNLLFSVPPFLLLVLLGCATWIEAPFPHSLWALPAFGLAFLLGRRIADRKTILQVNGEGITVRLRDKNRWISAADILAAFLWTEFAPPRTFWPSLHIAIKPENLGEYLKDFEPKPCFFRDGCLTYLTETRVDARYQDGHLKGCTTDLCINLPFLGIDQKELSRLCLRFNQSGLKPRDHFVREVVSNNSKEKR